MTNTTHFLLQVEKFIEELTEILAHVLEPESK
jgi:hypothetical protein